MTTDALSPQHEAFVSHYLVNGGNGTQAAIDAGYSANSAHVTASRLLRNAKVQEAIQRKQALVAVRDDLTIERWRREVMADWQAARDAGSWSAVASMQVTMGRHLNALNDARSLNPEEKMAFAWLGAAMERLSVSQPSGKQAYDVNGRELPGADVDEQRGREAGQAPGTP